MKSGFSSACITVGLVMIGAAPRAEAVVPDFSGAALAKGDLADIGSWKDQDAPPKDIETGLVGTGEERLHFGPVDFPFVSYTVGANVRELIISGNTQPYFFSGLGGLIIGSGGILYSPASSELYSQIHDAVTLAADQIWTIESGGLQIGGPLSGITTLTKSGQGELLLPSGSGSDFSGKLILNEGTLVITGSGSIGLPSDALGTATLEFGARVAGAPPPTLVATHDFFSGSDGFDDGEVLLTNPIISNGVISVETDLELVLGGPITLNADTILQVDGEPLFITGPIGESHLIVPGDDPKKLTLDAPGIVMIKGTGHTYTGGTHVEQGLLTFLNSASLPAIGDLSVGATGYLGFGLDGSSADEDILTYFSRFDRANSQGAIGLDTDFDLSEVLTSFTGTLDLTGFHADARLGSATRASITGEIIPQGTNYRFGGGGGRLEVAGLDDALTTGTIVDGLITDTTDTSVRAVVVDSSTEMPLSLTLRLTGANTYSGGTNVANSGVVFAEGAMPATGDFTMDPASYIGTEDTATDAPGEARDAYLARFGADTEGIVGFDSAPESAEVGEPRTVTGVDMSRFTGGAYLGTSTWGPYDEFEEAISGPGLIVGGLLKPGSDGVHRFAGYKGGWLEVKSALNGVDTSVVIGDPDVLATFGDILEEEISTVALTGETNDYGGGTTFYMGQLALGHDNALGTGDLTVAPHNILFGFEPDGSGNFESDDLVPRLMSIKDTGPLTIANNVILDRNLDIGGNDLTFSGVISGPRGLNLDDFLTLRLEGANTFGGGVNVSDGATLELADPSATGLGPLTFGFSGGHAIFEAVTSTVHGLAGFSEFALISLEDDTILTVNQGQNSDFRGSFAGIDDGDGVVGGRLVKVGPGNLRLEGSANHFALGGVQDPDSGQPPVALVVQEGALVFGSDYAMTSTAAIKVSGGTLGIDGQTLTNPLLLESGVLAGWGAYKPDGGVEIGQNMTLAPGARGFGAIGHLGFASLTLASGGTMEWNLMQVGEGVTQDMVFGADDFGLLSLSITATAGEPFTIRPITLRRDGTPGMVTGFQEGEEYSWTLFSGVSIDDFNGDLSGLFVDASFFVTDMPGQSLSLLFENGDLQLQMIPEPSTYALMLVGLGVTGYGAWRRRRRSGE